MTSIDSSDITGMSTSEFIPRTSLEPLNQRRLLDRKNKRTFLTNRIEEAVNDAKGSMDVLHRSLDLTNMRDQNKSFGVGMYKVPNNDYMWKKGPI